MQNMLNNYSEIVLEGMLNCEITENLSLLRKKTQNSSWMVVSGSDQSELRRVFIQRGLSNYFDAGIFGSPDDKESIFYKEVEQKNNSNGAIYFGDSRYDFLASQKYNIDFSFMYGWTEFKEWNSYCKNHKIPYFRFIKDLIA